MRVNSLRDGTLADRKNDLLSRRTAPDRSIALLLVGTVLLLPPLATIFLIDGKLAGVPIPLLYILIVWGLLIAGGAVLARPLRENDSLTASTTGSEGQEVPRTDG